MELRKLGDAGIEVSRICFGALTMGPLQASLDPKEGCALLCHAFSKGINFIDTAQLYKSYPHISLAVKEIGRQNLVIATKSYAYDQKTAKETFDEALSKIGTDYIDVFLLHEQESEHTIRGHFEALEFLKKMKTEGHIKAIGLSTHRVDGVRAASKYRDYIDVIHPICNYKGVGIQDGSIHEMISEIKKFKSLGGGVYGMKPFGGGHLLTSKKECLDFVLSVEELDSIAIGMQSIAEIDANVSYFETGSVPNKIETLLNNKNRRVIIDEWCSGCGKCVSKCSHKALKVVNAKANVDDDTCVCCGYCGSACPDFCIKII